jgi:hypothetical protein
MSAPEMHRYRLILQPEPPLGGALQPAESYLKAMRTATWASSPVPVLAFAGGDDEPARLIGVWDCSEKLSFLYPLVEHMNPHVDRVLFYELLAPTPSHIRLTPKGVKRLVEESSTLGGQVPDTAHVSLKSVLECAEQIRTKFRLDHIVAIVEEPLLDDTLGERWFLRGTVGASGPAAAVSVGRILNYAAEPGMRLEAVAGMSVILAVFKSLFPELKHDDGRRCLFDRVSATPPAAQEGLVSALCEDCRGRINVNPLGRTLIEIAKSLADFGSDEPSGPQRVAMA